ncbi:MAG: zf-TFIIB domain-containing protein, partial [Fervidicoccaceae archaeon]
MTKFCPKCGGVMVPTKRGNQIVLKCTKCGYETK